MLAKVLKLAGFAVVGCMFMFCFCGAECSCIVSLLIGLFSFVGVLLADFCVG